ncbi:MAG: hypothetical protein AB4911_03995 [Oscillochloridaceae bacterium umkhey_bin13]
MIRTITGLFDTLSDAQNVAKDLIERGIPREDISLVAHDAGNANEAQHELGADNPMSTGAVGGSMVGGVVGLLVGAGLLTIPGIGPVLALGPIAAAIGSIGAAVGSTALGAGVGAGVGSLAGGLMRAGVPEDVAHIYAEGVRQGGVLLAVNVDAAMAERIDVDAVLRSYGVVDIDQRSKNWHKAEWDSSMATDKTNADIAQEQRTTSPSPTHTDFTRGPRTISGNQERDFQHHYESTVVAGKRPYSDYVQAYLFGSDMAANTRIRGHTWDAVELDLRRTWDLSHPNSWDEFKPAIRYAWEKGPGQR